MGKITDLLDARQFQTGLVDGVFALAFVLFAATVRVLGRRPPIAGAVFAIAGLAALTGTGPGRRALDGVGIAALLAVLLLIVGGAITRPLPPIARLTLGPVLLVPGSLVLGIAAHHHGAAWWASVLVVLAVPPCAVLAGDLDQFHARHAYGPLLLAITAGGLYLTVPDTEGARALLGVAIPFVLLTLPRPVATLGLGGAAAAVGLLGYDAVLEGVGRPGSVIGAFGCLGLLVYEPIGRRVFGIGRRSLVRGRSLMRSGSGEHLVAVAITAALHLAVVLWACRVAGRPHSATAALLLMIPAIFVGIAVAPAVPSPTPVVP